MNQPIAIGVEKYKEIIDKNAYYIDKTWMIKELLDQAASVNLFTRPRRFGKTLMLSTIRTFFEDERTYDGKKIDNRIYFEGKKILSAGERYVGEMGSYPVIKLSLKSAKQPDFQSAYRCLKDDIIDEFDRHKYVLNGEGLSEKEKEKYKEILDETASESDYATALKRLSIYLKKNAKGLRS